VGSLSLFPKISTTPKPQIKENRVSFDPTTTLKVPKFGNWLTLQRPFSPLGSIKLPLNDKRSDGPLGGQLKSPVINCSDLEREQNDSIKPNQEKFEARSDNYEENTPKFEAKPAVGPEPIPSKTLSPPPIPKEAGGGLQPRPRGQRKRSVPEYIERETKERYEQMKASLWDAKSTSDISDSDARSPRGQMSNGREARKSVRTPQKTRQPLGDATIRRTEVEIIGGAESAKDEINTPDTGVSRTAMVETAMRGRVLLPSMVDDRKGRSTLRYE
jgi:hypothetical protein